jgi:hypothetical protein
MSNSLTAVPSAPPLSRALSAPPLSRALSVDPKTRDLAFSVASLNPEENRVV